MRGNPLKVAWISFFPVEWLPDVPTEIRNLPRFHPATWQRVLLQEFLRDRELELHVFSVRKQFPRNLSFAWNGAHFHCLRVPGGLRATSLFWWDTWLIKKRLKAIQPELVHAWGSERGAALVATRLGFPFLITMQGLLEWYLERVDLGRIVRLEAALERAALKRASIVTTESTFGVHWLQEHYPHLRVLQAEHAPNWLFHQVVRRPETAPVRFLYVAPLSEIKGGDVLLLALDRLLSEVDFRLTVVGSATPGFLEPLRAKTSPKLWERIEFRQDLSPSEVADELSRTTIVLFPTRVDTSPNSVKEAAVAGVPVIASEIGGICDYIVPGENGLLFTPGSLEEFVEQIRVALSHPFFAAGRVNPARLEAVRKQLSPALMARNFRSAYEEALRQATRPGPQAVSARRKS